MKCYLAGPMSGLPAYNYPAFTKAAEQLRSKGFDIVSPHELHDGDTTLPYDHYLRAGLKALLDCDAIVLLDGWENSRGARIEAKVAAALRMRWFTVDTLTTAAALNYAQTRAGGR